MRPDADERAILSLAQAYQQLNRADRMEQALEHYARLKPESPESWYNLAAIQAIQSKPASAVSNLKKAFLLSDARVATNRASANLRTQIGADPRFDLIRDAVPAAPEFQVSGFKFEARPRRGGGRETADLAEFAFAGRLGSFRFHL